MILGEVRTFPDVRADKEQALKPLEEAERRNIKRGRYE